MSVVSVCPLGRVCVKPQCHMHSLHEHLPFKGVIFDRLSTVSVMSEALNSNMT